MYDITIVGGGIVGLSVAWAITTRSPHKKILVLEKEQRWGHHQTGHNSGEIHSGIFYPPDSLKANLCREGNRAMVRFCREQGIPHVICGKVVVATAKDQLSLLHRLSDRARLNGIEALLLTREALHELEPHCAGVAALHVPSTGIVDYQRVAETLATVLEKGGTELHLNTEVKRISVHPDSVHIDADSSVFESQFLINCAGLHSDRIAQLMGLRTGMRIIPIRGEYYRVTKEKQHLVNTLIYPLPNLRYPFLGIHFNRQMNGDLRVGPNAVLSLHREGYQRHAFDAGEAVELCGSAAFWRFARANWREGGKEWLRSLSKTLFLRRVQNLIPDLQARDLIDHHTGVRAQAVSEADGHTIDDFVIVSGPRSIHVCNAPSPAATAAIPIGTTVVDRLQQQGIL